MKHQKLVKRNGGQRTVLVCRKGRLDLGDGTVLLNPKPDADLGLFAYGERGPARTTRPGYRIATHWESEGLRETLVRTEVEDAAYDWEAHHARLRDSIRMEAERRISEGLVVNGSFFRCDDQAVNRLQAMLERARLMEAAGEAFSQSFRTESGVVMTLASTADVLALFETVTAYAGAVLSASASLQDTPPEDFADDRHWPDQGTL